MKLSKLSLKTRLILIFSITFIIFFGTYTKIQFDILNDTMQYDVEDDMKSLAGFLSTLVEIEVKGKADTEKEIKQYIKSKLVPILSNLKEEMFGPGTLYVLIMDEKGSMIFKSQQLEQWSKEEWLDIKANGTKYLWKTINRNKYRSGRFYYNIAGKYGICMELALNVDEPVEEFSRMSSNIMWGLIIGVAFSIFISVLLTPIAFSHIKKMTENASEISAKDLERRIELPESRDELHNLGRVINNMLDRIATAFESQKRFVADASHELRTPLSIMQAELELTLRKTDDPDIRNSIIIALEEIEHMTRLTSQLLALVKLDNTRIHSNNEDFLMDELLHDSIRAISRLAQKSNISINKDIEEGIIINADRNSIKRLLLNILDNAVKYSEPDSNIYVTLISDNRSSVKLTVKDQGAGMSPEIIKNIFKPFYRAPSTRTEVHGTGLGLPIVKKIIDMHKGEIEIKSTPGKGTGVEVSLNIESE